jgi:predicted DNA-binding transcriptional regulator AlpA
MNDIRFLTEHEVASLVRKSVFWLRRQRSSGAKDCVPYRKLGASVRYLESDVISWIESHLPQTCTRIKDNANT